MWRGAISKVMWVGRATVFLVGLAVVLALLFGAASTALGANGNPFLLGRENVASQVSRLVKHGGGPALKLQVGSGPPLAVNSSEKVANFNADTVDGLSASELRGQMGPPGPAGADGKTVLNGSGAPDVGLGDEGDYYIDNQANAIYGPKTANGWGSPTSLVGPPGERGLAGQDGADGKTVRNGSGPPSPDLGTDGDFYINTVADEIYGPKTGGAWGLPTSLVGPAGSAVAHAHVNPDGTLVTSKNVSSVVMGAVDIYCIDADVPVSNAVVSVDAGSLSNLQLNSGVIALVDTTPSAGCPAGLTLVQMRSPAGGSGGAAGFYILFN
jgi:hypothetical protein